MSEDERKKELKVPQENEKTTGNQTTSQKTHQMDKHLSYPLIRPFLKWIREVQQTDQRTQHEALHLRYTVDRLYMSAFKII